MKLKKITQLLHNPVVAVFIVAVPGIMVFNWLMMKKNPVAQHGGTFIALLLIVYLAHVLLTNKEEKAVSLSLAILGVAVGTAVISTIVSYVS